MLIEGKDFRMEKLKDAPFYNLSLLITINKGTDKEREEYKIVSYGIPFDVCINKIVDHKMRRLEGRYTVQEYIEKYEQFVNEIGNEIE